jgi:hypothetical protein
MTLCAACNTYILLIASHCLGKRNLSEIQNLHIPVSIAAEVRDGQMRSISSSGKNFPLSCFYPVILLKNTNGLIPVIKLPEVETDINF